MTKMSRFAVVVLLALSLCTTNITCNSEGDALYTFKTNLADPNNVLASWDPTMVNPCTWFHVTCNAEKSVSRVELGNAGLSGNIVPELGMLVNLQYLQVEMNNISGAIPAELGNLTSLVSLGLSNNRLTGRIPATLGNLKSLRFARLNSNKLTGHIPNGIIQLVQTGNLIILNVSDNRFAGTAHVTKGKGFKITTIIQDPRA